MQESNGVMKSREVLATEWKCKLESSTRLNRQREQGEVWALVDKKCVTYLSMFVAFADRQRVRVIDIGRYEGLLCGVLGSTM